MDKQDRINRIVEFKSLLRTYNKNGSPEVRSNINQKMQAVRRDVITAGCMKTFTISPPPAIGGMIAQNVDPFENIFDPPYRQNMIPTLQDMLDQALGVFHDDNYREPSAKSQSGGLVPSTIRKGYVFVAMPMDDSKPEYEDVYDAIKEVAIGLELVAERVDDDDRNERITDRILQGIQQAEFVVADLTAARPNVFYEAGFAHGLGKLPIYIAKKGTKFEFDVKDYPIITFENMRQLRDKLGRRLSSLRKPS